MNESAQPVPAPSLVADDPLVLAMPRKELFRFSGFSTAIDLTIIESLASDSWYTVASSLISNFDAKEVRLGLIFERAEHVLLDESGVLLHTIRLGPEVGTLGKGVKALRDLALLAGARFVGVERVRCELTGFLNEDGIAGYKGAMVMVYRCRAPDEAQAPTGMNWIERQQLSKLPIDPVSVMVAEKLYSPAPPKT